jgi:hypothetical protein
MPDTNDRRPLSAASIVAVAAAICFFAVTALSCAKKEAAGPLLEINYSNWEKTTDTSLNFPIPGHESRHRIIYMNRIGMDHRKSGKRSDYPEGTIVLKEIYEGLDAPAAGERPLMLDIMIKDRNAEDARGGWRWIVRDGASGADKVITGDFCAVCHAEANRPHPYGDKNAAGEDRDYLFY